MTTTLDQLPFDILFHIASSLFLDDIVHLGQTCRQLKALLDERTLCRRTVEIDYPHTEEARLAQRKEITYKQAFQAIYDRRHALSNAYPFSARILGQGSTILYRQSTICVLQGDIVRISRVDAQYDAVQLNLTAIIRPILESAFASYDTFTVSMLYYSDSILAIHVTEKHNPYGNYIFAINTTAHPAERVIRAFELASSAKLFVRHNSHYLYYGTHSGIGDDDHHKWVIDGISLNKQYPLPSHEKPLLLENFHGSDIGSTVAFEIHNGYFYAVSNQGTFEVEEIDYTSFYHWVSFPVDQPIPDAVERDERLYRRQHKQGPIHDSWTDLSLQIDERTNETVIVESRREWAQASSRQSRTFYVTKLDPLTTASSCASSPSAGPSETRNLPEGDAYLDVIDATNKPNYMATPDQFSWMRHPEFATEDLSPRSFILARTKFRAYNYSCTSFLDLVEDDRCCNDPSKPPCLRLRIGSRREAPQNLFTPVDLKGKNRMSDSHANFKDKASYRHSPVRLWPPPASQCPCSKRLHDILSPALPFGPSHGRTVTGVLDERYLVYMVKPGRSYGSNDDNTLGTIVLVDFTRPLLPKANASSPTPSASISDMSDSGCIMDVDVDDANAFNSSAWTWSPRSQRLCQSKTCR